MKRNTLDPAPLELPPHAPEMAADLIESGENLADLVRAVRIVDRVEVE